MAFERGLWRPGMVKLDDNNPERSLFHVLGNCLDFQQEVMYAQSFILSDTLLLCTCSLYGLLIATFFSDTVR